MNLDRLKSALSINDGSLPDINFDFCGARVVAQAYALVQDHATALTSAGGAHYWSKSKNEDCQISFGENPAELVLSGEAESFHVVFGGLVSDRGDNIPDLGFFVLGDDFVALDYRMGPEWSTSAIEGLLSLMDKIASLAPNTAVSHETGIAAKDDLLMQAFEQYRADNKRFQATGSKQPAPEA